MDTLETCPTITRLEWPSTSKFPRSANRSRKAGSLKWLKPDGAAVKVDEPLFELETDKASQEITAQAAGVLTINGRQGRRRS